MRIRIGNTAGKNSYTFTNGKKSRPRSEHTLPSNVLVPNLDRIWTKLGIWIRIRTQEGKIDPQRNKQGGNCMF